jgi:hypothetical protein
MRRPAGIQGADESGRADHDGDEQQSGSAVPVHECGADQRTDDHQDDGDYSPRREPAESSALAAQETHVRGHFR